MGWVIGSMRGPCMTLLINLKVGLIHSYSL